MRKNDRAQASIEFISLIGFFFFIFIVIFTLLMADYNKVNEGKINTRGHDTADVIANEISLAWEVEDGYSHSFSIPDNLAGINYTVNVSKNYIILSWDLEGGKRYASSLFSAVVNGTENSSYFEIQKKELTVRKENGKVYLG